MKIRLGLGIYAESIKSVRCTIGSTWYSFSVTNSVLVIHTLVVLVTGCTGLCR